MRKSENDGGLRMEETEPRSDDDREAGRDQEEEDEEEAQEEEEAAVAVPVTKGEAVSDTLLSIFTVPPLPLLLAAFLFLLGE